jgi:outer membrane protein OmpU
MKKILLTTTALVATSGFAMADGHLMTVTGSADMGLRYNDSGVNKTTVESDVDINFAVSGETDYGIAWTAAGGVSNDTNAANSGVSTGSVDAGSVSISGEFGTISVGNVDAAISAVGIADVGYDGIGLDNVAESSRAPSNPDVRWAYAMDGISLVATTNSHTDASSVSVGWTSGALSMVVAHNSDGNTGGVTNNAASVSTSIDDVSVSVMVADSSTDAVGSSQGMALSWMMGERLGTVTFVLADSHSDTDATYGVGFSKDLGGNATLAGGYGTADGVAVGDLGISFSF